MLESNALFTMIKIIYVIYLTSQNRIIIMNVRGVPPEAS